MTFVLPPAGVMPFFELAALSLFFDIFLMRPLVIAAATGVELLLYGKKLKEDDELFQKAIVLGMVEKTYMTKDQLNIEYEEELSKSMLGDVEIQMTSTVETKEETKEEEQEVLSSGTSTLGGPSQATETGRTGKTDELRQVEGGMELSGEQQQPGEQPEGSEEGARGAGGEVQTTST